MSSSSSFAGAGGFMVRQEGVFMVKTVERAIKSDSGTWGLGGESCCSRLFDS